MKKKNKENILIVVAHPDDEVLGCGGIIAKYKNKKKFKIIFIGEGTSCRFSKNDNDIKIKRQILKRKKQSIECLKFLGVKSFTYYNFPCGRFDDVSIIDINKTIENEIKIFKPNTIITHNADDCNNDHRIVYRSVMMSTRPMQKNNFLKTIITFETISSTEWNFDKQFSPNYFEILNEKNLKEKIRAFNFYKSEVQKRGMPRTSDGLITLAKYRGKMISNSFAEAFRIIRKVK